MCRLVGTTTLAMTLLTVLSATGRQDDSETAQRIAVAAQAFVEARKACEEDAGRMWGRPLWGPFMLVDPATRRFVASEAIEPGGSGNATVPVRVGNVVVHVGALPPNFSVANTAATYAGRRWAMALWPLPDSAKARRQLLCHEQWHRVQQDLGLVLDTPACDHLDEEQGRLWLRLEMRALAAALRAKDATGKWQAIADALLFRDRRQLTFATAAEAERKLELSEGLAEYTGLRLSGREDLAEWGAQNLDSAEQKGSLVRSFPYATGPAYGLLLDEFAPDWRQGLDAEQDLASTLGAAGEAPRNNDLEEAMARYQGAELRQEEQHRVQALQARRRELTAQLVDGMVLEVPMGSDGRISFDPGSVVPLPPHGTVYPGATLTGPWGKLEAPEAHVLIAPDWQRAFVSAAEEPRRAPDGQAVTGRGWALRLEPGWEASASGGRLRVRKID